jgi:hypothetical protein
MAVNTLLEGPAPPSCTSRPIDFTKEGLPEYAHSFAMAIDDIATPVECAALLNAAETRAGAKWEQAMINIGNGEQKMVIDRRYCGRIIYDNPELAQRIQERVLPYLPQEIVTLTNKPGITGKGPVQRGETWRMRRLNEKLRFLKYTSGMYFREHCDGSYVTEDGKQVSFLTIHLYLNGNDPTVPTDEAIARWEQGGRRETEARREEAEARQALIKAFGALDTAGTDEDRTGAEGHDDGLDLIGGATRFYSWRDDTYFDYKPKLGSCIVFQHRNLIHSGEDVIQGTKYTMRAEVLYEKVEDPHRLEREAVGNEEPADLSRTSSSTSYESFE